MRCIHSRTENQLQLGVCNKYVADSCIKPGVFGVAQFSDVLEIYPRPTLVAKVTKIWEF